ncbi:MAG: pentapeptide repeat-containing protein, partial [Myxococcota bacterium]
MARFEAESDHVGAELSNQTIQNETILAVNFERASLQGSMWSRCDFTNKGTKGIRFVGADLTGAVFEDCTFEILHAEDVAGKGAVFRRCRFGFVNFSGADLEGAVFEQVRVRSGAYFSNAKCKGMTWDFVAERASRPDVVKFDGADLCGASLSAHLCDDEVARLTKFDIRQEWSEFGIQKAKTDATTTFVYGPLPFADAPKAAAPARKLGKRKAVLPLDEWGTIASVVVAGDVVFTGEGGWNGDAKRRGAKGRYRVSSWRAGERLWEAALLPGSGNEGVDLVVGAGQVYALTCGTAFVLDARSGEIRSREEVGSANWVAPGVVALYKTDHVIVRALGDDAGVEHRGRWIEAASRDGSFLWSQLEYDKEAKDWRWALRTKGGDVVATRTGRHTSACFSADGTRHASAWHKTVIEVRDATAGTLLATFDPA